MFQLTPETLQTEFVREQTAMLSQVPVQQQLRLQLLLSSSPLLHHQVKYRQDGRKELAVSLYAALPDTLQTRRAKELSHMQSEVAPPRLRTGPGVT